MTSLLRVDAPFSRLLVGMLGIAMVGLGVSASAQPDPRQMSGIPRPDGNLADGAITVRVIRGSFANNVTGHPVELRAGDDVLTTETDAEGRATFANQPTGAEVRVATTLDGQELVSQPFPAPGQGGVAVLLVGATAGGDTPIRAPASSGQVSFGQDSRIQIALGEETVEVYYLLDVLNVAATEVEPQTPFEFFLPPGAQGATILQASSPRTLVDGPRVWVSGGFAPGVTRVLVGYILPYSGGSLTLSQAFPADFVQFLVLADKWGAIDMASRQIDRRGEMAAGENGAKATLWGAGGSVPAGEIIELELSGLPHHSAWPRGMALALAGLIIALSAWASSSNGSRGHDPASQRLALLQARREKLFTELVKVERQQRLGQMGATRYGTRRAELIDQLQRVLRDLDEGLVPDGWATATPRS